MVLLSSIPGPEKNVVIPSLLFKAWIDQKPTAKAELDQKSVCNNGSNSDKAGFILRANLSFPTLRITLSGPKYLKKLRDTKVMKLAPSATKGQ